MNLTVVVVAGQLDTRHYFQRLVLCIVQDFCHAIDGVVIGQGNRGKPHPHRFVGNLRRCQRTVGRIGMYM